MTAIDRLHQAEAAAREALSKSLDTGADAARWVALEVATHNLLAALDAARGEAVAWWDVADGDVRSMYPTPGRGLIPVYTAPPAALAVSAANVTPMRQPRTDLARLVESINAAVYANGDGLSVTEAIGALELAKLELLKDQEQ